MQDSIIRAVSAVAAAACFSFAVIALTWAWADLMVKSAAVPAKSTAISAVEPERLQTAVRRIGQAERLNPWNAEYAAELGRHYGWLAWQSHGTLHAAKYLDAAQSSYASAVRLRPTWGYAWANLAESRIRAGQNDEETRFALQRAMELAPFEAATQLKVLLVGFSLWDTLPESTRNDVSATLRRALLLNNQVDQIIRLAIQTNRTVELTSVLQQKRHLDLYERIKAQAKN